MTQSLNHIHGYAHVSGNGNVVQHQWNGEEICQLGVVVFHLSGCERIVTGQRCGYHIGTSLYKLLGCCILVTDACAANACIDGYSASACTFGGGNHLCPLRTAYGVSFTGSTHDAWANTILCKGINNFRNSHDKGFLFMLL